MADWKAFRISLSELPLDEQLYRVADYWSKAPLMKHAYDCEDYGSLPGPWEMILQGDWCRDSVAVGMEFTLRLALAEIEDMKLCMYRDYNISAQMLCLKIDNKLLLNYSLGEVVDIPSDGIFLLTQFKFNGRSYSAC